MSAAGPPQGANSAPLGGSAAAQPQAWGDHPTTNVDPAELAKFSALAHRWWDPGSEFKPLHDINPLRLDWIDRMVSGLAGRRVVDVGCGGGILSEAMASRGATVTAIDLSERALGVARLHQLESGIEVDYRLTSAEALAQAAPASFDVVTCLELLEHVPEPGSTVAACAALVRPGGYVLFSTLNRNPRSYLLAVVGAEYVLRLLPRGTHDWARFLKPSELARHARAAGLDVGEIIGMTYNPLTRTYRLEPDISVNYLMACRRPGVDA
jgi:2-polyprenyl-6-hydroxyphenyl methylase/3-demethylubiquinone-9 3-methyltransferase